ncbi:MAG: hypothetical protein ABSB35_33705 [Bryobacteraceae bacterium]|jgi:hypothetical protein
MTNEETTTAATVAEQGAHGAPQKASSKKRASPKKAAPKGHKCALITTQEARIEVRIWALLVRSKE